MDGVLIDDVDLIDFRVRTSRASLALGGLTDTRKVVADGRGPEKA